MLAAIFLVLFASLTVSAAWFVGSGKWAAVRRSSRTVLHRKINTAVELSSPKVVNNLEIKAGEKCVVCRCWKSGKFPLCDGTHVKHNEENGDNVGPAIVAVKKE